MVVRNIGGLELRGVPTSVTASFFPPLTHERPHVVEGSRPRRRRSVGRGREAPRSGGGSLLLVGSQAAAGPGLGRLGHRRSHGLGLIEVLAWHPLYSVTESMPPGMAQKQEDNRRLIQRRLKRSFQPPNPNSLSHCLSCRLGSPPSMNPLWDMTSAIRSPVIRLSKDSTCVTASLISLSNASPSSKTPLPNGRPLRGPSPRTSKVCDVNLANCHSLFPSGGVSRTTAGA